jgi:PAS domain S-box-containing protein
MSAAVSGEAQHPAFLQGGGEMGAQMRAKDWGSTVLGPPERWPQALRTAVRLILNSGHPMYIFWGPTGACLYNDAYSRSIGPERHPASLGKPARGVWDEIWPIIGPQIAQVMAGGPATWHENALVPITRNGRREDVYWTYTYSPIDDEASPNGVGGVMVICTETTEQVQRAAQSAEEKSRLAQLFEQAPSFVAVLRGPDHVFEITNAGYLQLIGHRDVLGKSVAAALPEIAGQGFLELLDEVYASGNAFVGRGVSAQLQRGPGEPLEQRFVDFVYQPVFGANGEVTGILVQGHDITDQKLAEFAAAGREARFRLLAQSMPNHVWTALPDGRLDWFNDQVYAYSGAGEGELDGASWTRIVHPDDIGAAGKAWAAAIASGEPYATEFRLRRHDGAYRRFIARAVPIRGSGGGIESWVGTNTDIEDQKAAEDALRESNLRTTLALASAEMGVWQCFVVDGRFVDLTGDERALRLLGGRPGQPATFEAFAARVHPEDRARLAPAAERALTPGGDGQLSLDYRVLDDDGEPERWVQARAQLVESAGGARLVGTVRDITHRKDAEEQQRLLSAELQHRIKNTLAMVSAIAMQTLRGEDIAERRENFTSRIGALARAHDLLLASTWTSASLRDVVERAIAAHRSEAREIVLSGPDIELTPRQALTMVLTVHELATNAVKYGALSEDGGRVRVHWSLDERDGEGRPLFTFAWRESGGPAVERPTRPGFGTRLITRVFPNDFEGSVSIEYEPGGLVCVLTAAADKVKPAVATATAGTGDGAPA